jgi:hypothetical protein
MSFTPAKFNTGLNETETTIVTRYMLLIIGSNFAAWGHTSSLGTFGKFSKIILNRTKSGNTRTTWSVTISGLVKTKISWLRFRKT